jgi:hypothetical protein
MTHEDLIRGSQAILDFLLETQDDDWTTRSSFITPKMSVMDDTLSEIIDKGNISLMVDFTQKVNKEYQIMPEPLWKESPKEFFSTDKSIRFFNSILRDKKINQILS